MSDEAPPEESEHRQTTVLFADISGFMTMSEKIDPEETASIMNRCFERLEGIVRDHGGHVDKYIGDAIMALFGAPRAIEQAPKQAINAAIEMRNVLGRLNDEMHLPVRLEIHVGINTGHVLAGRVGGAVKRDFTVLGDAVNLASRLTGAAPTGSIYVGPDTHRYTEHEFEYRRLGRLKVKGRELPVTAYEVLSSHEQLYRRRPARTDSMIGSKLVGRDHELAKVRAAVAATAEGRGAVLTLVGEAGLGKSRLMADAMTLPEMEAVTLLEGRSLSLSQGLAFHPFVDLLRAWAEITHDDGEQRSLAKLEAAIERLFGEEAGEILPPVATLMGMRLTGAHAERLAGITGEPLERLITRSMRELVRRLAVTRPLVLVFEDLHWADLSSQKLLEFLLRLVDDTAVLFILVVRPDPAVEHLVALARGEHARHLVDIDLRPLRDQHCDQLIQNLLGTADLPYSLLAAIARKAEGNPFYIEEVIRSLIDQGVLAQRHGVFRVTGDVDGVVIPGTIAEVIMARVDRLPPETRRLLQVSAVIGRRLPYRILTAIVEHDRGIDLALARLTRSQLLEESRTAEELEYVFKHALIQETVYGSILHKTCKELHLEVARSIERLYADRLPEFYGMLAYHYSRGEDLEKGEDYLFKAGDEAARAAAPSEALRYFREASRLYLLIHRGEGDPRKKALLARNIALALFQTGNLTESIQHFNEALALIGQPVRTSRLAVALGFAADLARVLAWLYAPIRMRRPRVATEADREAHAIRYNRSRAQMTSDPKRYFVDSIQSFRRLNALEPSGIEHAPGAYAGGGALFAYSGISLAISKRFLAVAEGLVANASVQDRFFYRVMHFVYDYLAGNWDDDRAIDEALISEALRHGQVWETFVYRGLDSERRAHRGDFVGAARQVEWLKELSEVYGFFVARSNEYAMSSVMFLEQRQLDAASEMIELYYVTQHEEVFHLFALGTKAKIQVLTGNRPEAAETLARAEEILGRIGRATAYHVSVFRTGRLLHDVNALEASLTDGRRPPSRALVRQATRSARLAVKVAATVARERVEVYRLTGTLYWLLGRTSRAFAWWRRSIAAGNALGARPELARTYTEVGVRLSAPGAKSDELDGVEAAGYLDKARALCDTLDLVWDRAQLAQADELPATG